ncbi:unnamed protein product [Microthlaspi erraticum]|uniref:F-box domain-containing protein n=1 Tax=Microthlaspi erraticum TaxID=1685480 RepID=A0A6D2I7B6_9BRAS|nr:unnamed protein product [Microthlaspi erraticum]
MAKMSNISRDLVEEILSRVPATSLRKFRSTCKMWNSISKDGTFTKNHLAQSAEAGEGEILAIVLNNSSLHLMSVNLNYSDPSITPRGNLTSLNDSEKQIEVTQVYHCEGLLLCVTEDYTKLVVWNPYSGQTRWISVEPNSVDHSKFWYAHALGYDKSTQKILRFAHPPSERCVHEIYHVNSDSWRVLDDVTPDWNLDLEYDKYALSLKGNAYCFAQDKEAGGNVPGFLLCFDFTTERFAPRLSLPFESYHKDAVTLSTVREEQLAVLFQNLDTYEMDVWVTTKIEPNAASWSKFLSVDMSPLTWFQFFSGGSFITDEEKRAVIVFDEDHNYPETSFNTVYFIGENGYFRDVDFRKVTRGRNVFPHAFSYVPSSAEISTNENQIY